MQLTLRIHYQTGWGQRLAISSNHSSASADAGQLTELTYQPGNIWSLTLSLEQPDTDFSYKYWLIQEDGRLEEEFGAPRVIAASVLQSDTVQVRDQWRSAWDGQNALFSSAFTRVLMHRPVRQAPVPASSGSTSQVLLQLNNARIDAGHVICVSGDAPVLGAWDEQQAVVLHDGAFPLWQAVLPAEGLSGSYKYGIYDLAARKVVTWEAGPNRTFELPDIPVPNTTLIHRDEGFRFPVGNWKGAGVALPVFSLRTEASWGVGEFADLIPLTDWANLTGMKLIQILPVNDTIATHSWADSYPYAAISVFALHPMYLNPVRMGRLQDEAAMATYEAERLRLNGLASVAYNEVMALKSAYFKQLYDQDKTAVLESPDFQAFFEANASWLRPYAAFSCLRDRYQTADFHRWGELSTFDEAATAAFTAPDAAHYDDVAIHYFIQYHLHLQLQEAASYARSRGVVLKGDIPIGIYRHSVDAWIAPHLYNMDMQAGAPPDAFAVAGQNWRFPTYNWQVMARDGYAWWRQRMQHMSRYFDAYRIDHILGFFRIWEIPGHAVQGIMGHFNPCLPFTRTELLDRGIWLDYERFCKPFIRTWILNDFFGQDAAAVAREFLQQTGPESFDMKPEFATQRQVEAYIQDKITHFPESKAYFDRVEAGLYSLIAEVIFFEVPGTHGEGFSPRIAMHFTRSYQALDQGTRAALDSLYMDFFFRRHEAFWRAQAMVKLPAIKNATDMLVCGEDLGMVPDCVPGVMAELGLLSLEIQRMPKATDRRFGHPADAPYMSVISPSTHDMPGIRGWWEEDPDATQQFYSQILGRSGGAPFFCEPYVVRDILVQHMFSPAMWAIFPIQDLLGMDNTLRRQDPREEQINVPANPDQHWEYRLHLTIEQLMQATAFTQNLATIIKASGRNAPY
ncbi:MAG: 4-alpha-glucanotransferase [Bacteroidia bacterium]|nr:4-alpha-glucanotransferase [Bacteroidia bacterium]